MTESHDLLVVGAGPAGGEAALAAASAGLRVALIDESPAPGGQVWRAPRTKAAQQVPAHDIDRRLGNELRARLSGSNVEVFRDTQVWDAQSGFNLSCVSDGGARQFRAPRLVLATGAIERVLPFEGWTTPGIFGLAAATAILKAEKALFGHDIVVAGQGPLLIAVAAKALALGIRPRAIVDRARRADWLDALPGYAAVPSQLLTGLGWQGRLALSRIPHHYSSEVICAEGGESLCAVTVRHLKTGRTHRIEADTLYVGNGLSPADELHRLLGVRQERDALRGGHRAICDEEGRSSVQGVYIAGDGGGVHGALSSAEQGRIAGFAAARDHGALSEPAFATELLGPRSRLRRFKGFADASCRLMRFPEDAVRNLAPDTIVCRCEDVTCGDINAAIQDGACDLNQLKHFTRLGMGPCQGRICARNASALMVTALGTDADLRFTPRAPVRPVEMEQLVGDFDYDDIPVPKPAPL